MPLPPFNRNGSIRACLGVSEISSVTRIFDRQRFDRNFLQKEYAIADTLVGSNESQTKKSRALRLESLGMVFS